ETKVVKKEDKHDHKHTAGKVIAGAAVVAAGAAIVHEVTKKHDDVKKVVGTVEKKQAGAIEVEQKVEVVEVTTVQDTKTVMDKWLVDLTDKIVILSKQGGANAQQEITIVVEEAQKELDVTISKAKDSYHKQTDITEATGVVSERNFFATLEWIRSSALTQVAHIKQIAVQGAKSKTDVRTEIENLTLVAKKQVDTALEVHIVETATEAEEELTVVGEVTTKPAVKETIVVVVEETKEQAQQRTHEELATVVEQTKLRMTEWLEVLLGNLRVAIRSGNEDVRQELEITVKSAEQEATKLVQAAKLEFVSIGARSAALQTSPEITALVAKARKQALDCLDNIKATVTSQTEQFYEIITSIDVDDAQVIDERFTLAISRTKKQVVTTLDHATETAIVAAFEGKTVTWVETAEVPKSFEKVEWFAFDLAGTVYDFLPSVLQAWSVTSAAKQGKLCDVDLESFVLLWHKQYLEERVRTSYETTDKDVFHLVLVRLLKEKMLDTVFTEDDTEKLSESWFHLGLFGDSADGVKRIKKCGKFAVSLSHAYSIRSMASLSASACVCWNAQLSAELFASSGANPTETLMVRAGQILALQPEQLAVVSSNAHVLEAAKQHGYRTVQVHRYEAISEESHFDMKVDGLDVLAESFETYQEQKKTKEATEAPTTRSWFQRLLF
ncbi:hypothetical protein DFQ28_005630, partial [Apophysomyces sp. BC1034]